MRPGTFSSLLEPLRSPIFRGLWLSTVFSNMGTLMQSVGAAWLMTSMTSSPMLVGLVPASVFLPTFLVGIWGGVLADVVERRRILIVTQTGMMLAALAMGVFTVSGQMSPGLLLSLLFTIGLLNALNLPAWQSQIQEIVPPTQVAAAVSLNSISFNSARTLGPALGGMIVAAAGPAAVFFANAVSFLGPVLVLVGWKRPAREKRSLDVWRSLREGFRFVATSPVMRAPLLRVSAFSFFASAVWAVLPLLARDDLKTGPLGYGLLVGAFGLGSITISGFIPALRHRFHPDRIVIPATLVLAVVLCLLGVVHHFPTALLCLFAGGAAWVAVLIQFNVAVQISVPEEFRGRALSFYLVFFQGSLGLGSAFNGWIATHLSIPHALIASGVLLAFGLPLAIWFPLGSGRSALKE